MLEFSERHGDEQTTLLMKEIEMFEKGSQARFASQTSRNLLKLAAQICRQGLLTVAEDRILWSTAYALINSIGVVHDRVNLLEERLGTKGVSQGSDGKAVQEPSSITPAINREVILKRIRTLEENLKQLEQQLPTSEELKTLEDLTLYSQGKFRKWFRQIFRKDG
jgi:hypothetical protein